MKAKRLFTIGLIGLFLVSGLTGISVAQDDVVKVGKGSLERRDNFFIMRLKGSPSEMGQQHALLLKELLPRVREDIWDCICTDYLKFLKGINQTSFVKNIAEAVAYRMCQEYLPYIPQEYIEEMKALAATSGIRFEDILVLNLRHEIAARLLSHCTSFAVNGAKTWDGSLLHSYNMDGGSFSAKARECLDVYKGIIFYQPVTGNSFVSITMCGDIGAFCGMNDKGISLSLVRPQQTGAEKGMPLNFLLRAVLQKAQTLAGAVEMIKSAEHTITAHVTLGDGKTNEAVTLSVSPGQTVIKKMTDATLVMGRGEKEVPQVLASPEFKGKLSVTDLAGILRYKPDEPQGFCSIDTSYSMIFHPASQRFWVALGKCPAPLSHFYGFDLKTGKELSGKDSLFPSILPNPKEGKE